MNRTTRAISAVAVLLALVPFSPAAAATDERERIRPRYQRDGAVREAFAHAPDATLPEELRLAVPEQTEDSQGAVQALGDAGATRRRTGTPTSDDASPRTDLDDRARAAASWSANEIAATTGRLEYYRAGVHRGMRVALSDERLGEWDYLQGMRLGRRDPEARRVGFEAGALAARDTARERAGKQVADQFMDLSRDPQRAPDFTAPAWAAAGGWAAPVTLVQVFEELPPRSFPGLGGRLDYAFRGWSRDPWSLYECSHHRDFHDAGWKDPHRAFDLWRARHAGRWFERLGRADRERFRDVFESEFAYRLRFAFERHLARAFDEGFEDGWNYGAFLAYEWAFRRGYNEGFDAAARNAADVTFGREFAPAYAGFYDAAFEEWSHSARPGIVGVTLVDGDDDGVFEPGEALTARYELANYGGRPGTFAASLGGGVLESDSRGEVSLPARRIAGGELGAPARIDPRTAVHTRTELLFEVAGLTQRVPLRVSYPLEFAGEPAIEHVDALGGSALVSAHVLNASRRPVRGLVSLARVDGYDLSDEVDLGRIEPGRERRVSFTLDGLRTLDLLAGRVDVRLEAHDGQRLHDSSGARAPNLSLDLGNRALLSFLVALGRDRTAGDDEVAEAQRLMLDRLRVDWRAAVRSRGNPYKTDRTKGTTRTALGDLVQTYRRERRSLVNPDVFEDLQIEILELSSELPGTHPFLRKNLRKLARELG